MRSELFFEKFSISKQNLSKSSRQLFPVTCTFQQSRLKSKYKKVWNFCVYVHYKCSRFWDCVSPMSDRKKNTFPIFYTLQTQIRKETKILAIRNSKFLVRFFNSNQDPNLCLIYFRPLIHYIFKVKVKVIYPKYSKHWPY